MSEYQYYEFLALDRRLGEKEMREIRAVSSRAEITSTSFVNEYNYGDFKGDEFEFLERYFDVHVYVATGRSSDRREESEGPVPSPSRDVAREVYELARAARARDPLGAD